jgi:hypothetical protein
MIGRTTASGQVDRQDRCMVVRIRHPREAALYLEWEDMYQNYAGMYLKGFLSAGFV